MTEADGRVGPLASDQVAYLRACILRFFVDGAEMREEVWAPIALMLQFDEGEVARIRDARRTSQDTCLLVLGDPTRLAEAAPLLHAALSSTVGALRVVGYHAGVLVVHGATAAYNHVAAAAAGRAAPPAAAPAAAAPAPARRGRAACSVG